MAALPVPALRGTRDARTPSATGWPVAGMVCAIVLLHAAGAGLLLAGQAGSAGLGLGVGLTAYTLGLRHAFDADHIAAIDNTTRKLVGDGGRPTSVGFWFSLGHSTLVLALTLALALGARALAGPIEDPASGLHRITAVLGTTVSALFLYVIAGINLALLVAGARRMRAGGNRAQDDGGAPGAGGPMTRAFGRVLRAVRTPAQMYPLGLLFGLGFDTATEIALLVLAATTSAAGAPWWSLLALPLLFAAGMSLLDTSDGLLMRFAYGWAFARPGRRMRYDLTVTALSVGVAFLVGTIEVLGLVGGGFRLDGSIWTWVAGVDLGAVGLGVVVLLAVVWLVAVAAWSAARRRDRARRADCARDGVPAPDDTSSA